MGREEQPPFARGETIYNGSPIDATDNTTLVGVNLEGKEYVFEPNSADQGTGYGTNIDDQSGRPVHVKVVRNISGVNLKPARIAHFSAASTSGAPYECRVDGYCHQLADRPAGVIDEFLPPAGVVNNDLFYLVIDGPTKVTNQTASPITTAIGSRLVPAATGSTAGDDLAGRVALADFTGATAVLAENIQHNFGFADAINSTTSAVFNAVADLTW